MITRSMILDNGISHTVDDALNGRPFELADLDRYKPVLVGFQCGFQQLIVLTYSYLPSIELADDEAIELAEDYLRELGWLSDAMPAPEITVYHWADLPEDSRQRTTASEQYAEYERTFPLNDPRD